MLGFDGGKFLQWTMCRHPGNIFFYFFLPHYQGPPFWGLVVVVVRGFGWHHNRGGGIFSFSGGMGSLNGPPYAAFCCLQRAARRNELLLAKGRQYLQAFPQGPVGVHGAAPAFWSHDTGPMASFRCYSLAQLCLSCPVKSQQGGGTKIRVFFWRFQCWPNLRGFLRLFPFFFPPHRIFRGCMFPMVAVAQHAFPSTGPCPGGQERRLPSEGIPPLVARAGETGLPVCRPVQCVILKYTSVMKSLHMKNSSSNDIKV